MLTVNGAHGVGEHALEHVVGAHRVDPGLSLNRLLMEAQHAQENPLLHAHATQILAKLFHLHHHACQIQGWIEKTTKSRKIQNNEITIFAANLEELGDLFEGDMIRPQDLTRNHINSPIQRWPNGEVPYVVEGSFSEYSIIISFT